MPTLAARKPRACWARYAVERLLYRLGQSRYRDRFLLKGAMLLAAWGGDLWRPTTDLDLLGFGASDIAHLEEVFGDICRMEVEDDGVMFRDAGIKGALIREDQTCGGVRLRLNAILGPARIPVQVDVGSGDAVTPAAQELEYPTILDLPHPRLRAYPPETVVAEKFQAMVELDMKNSRMKDFYDLWTLSQFEPFDGGSLVAALRATFRNRGVPLPEKTPVGLGLAFTADPARSTAWTAFLRRSRLNIGDRSLTAVTRDLEPFLIPPAVAAARDESFARQWPPGGPWEEVQPVVQ